MPTYKKVLDVALYYLLGIFRGEPHPVPKTPQAKHNPLQRITYLAVVSFLVPFQIITGFVYYYYNSWPGLGIEWSLSSIALLHTAGAFAYVIFFIVHVYMTTTGETPFAHIKAMITGWEEIKHPEMVQDWEKR